MNLHIFQHVPFEGPGYIAQWAQESGNILTNTHLYKGEQTPDVHAIDTLCIMGGPMNVYQENKFPWLVEEKKFIEQAIAADKFVIGFCFGAQLIADALGSRVYPGPHMEIGWWPVRICRDANLPDAINAVPDSFMAFQWHGETFDIPDGAIKFAENDAFANQAFMHGRKVCAMQYHLEIMPDGVANLLKNCAADLTEGSFIQNKSRLLANSTSFGGQANLLLRSFLNGIFQDS